MLQPNQNHIILKQRFEVEVSDLTESWKWQERLSRFANGPLLERLSAMFDQQCDPNVIRHIESLELRVNLQDGANWEAILLEQISRQILEALPKQLLTEAKVQAPEEVGFAENFLTAFFYFLKTGRLPWWIGAATAANFEAKLRQVLESQLAVHWKIKFQEAVRSAAVRQRLSRQFSWDVLGRLVVVFLDENESELADCQVFANLVGKITGEQPVLLAEDVWNEIFEQPRTNPMSIWQAVLAHKIAQQPSILFKALHLKMQLSSLTALRLFAEQIEPKTAELINWAKLSPDKFEALLLQVLQTGKLPRQLDDRLKSGTLFSQQVFKKRRAEDLQIGRLDKKLESKTKKEKSFFEVKKLDEKRQMDDGVLREKRQLVDQQGDAEIFVRNAGVVILHPFLPALFGNLGYTKNGKLAKVERAVHLLQYLATGRLGVMEHELPLNKLLCGLPIEMPIRRQVRLTKKEKEAAEGLLQSVIGHWTSLGKTTPEGLRGTYCCREGKLSIGQDRDWLLQVEQRSFDILLTDLPWSISVVKLPWMQGILQVEWG